MKGHDTSTLPLSTTVPSTDDTTTSAAEQSVVTTTDEDITSIIYGEIYAIVTEEMRTVKYVTRSELKDHIRLVPENKSARYGDYQDIPLSNIRKMFRVVGSVHLF